MITYRPEPVQGPFIRDLSVPDPDHPLRPSSLRMARVPRAVRTRLIAAALLAWTAGLVLATFSLVRQAGAAGGPDAAISRER